MKDTNQGTLQVVTEVVMENEEGEEEIEFTQVTGSTPKRNNSTTQEKQDETMGFTTVRTPGRQNGRKQSKQSTKSPSVPSPPKVCRGHNRYSDLRGDDQNV